MFQNTTPVECVGGESPTLIFACSGAADCGEVADLAARQLTAEGWGTMMCLAGIGGRVAEIMHATQRATAILAIDGCPHSCAQRTLQLAGFQDIEHIQLAEFEFAQSTTPPSHEVLTNVMERAKLLLGALS